MTIYKYFLFIAALTLTVNFCGAAPLQKFKNVKLVDHPANDGDSFVVSISGTQTAVRLYFVDAPETSASSLALQRLREHTRYFGLSNANVTIDFGKKAKAFMKDKLSKPFYLYTAFAKAPGNMAKGRIYAFVITSSGKSLGGLLVREGLARAKGVGRETPNSVSKADRKEQLTDLERSAMMKRKGIWQWTDPDLLVDSRAEERLEKAVLAQFKESITTTPKLININTCSAEELKQLKGIGKKRAEIIIQNRPYKSTDDLLKISNFPYKVIIENINYFTVK